MASLFLVDGLYCEEEGGWDVDDGFEEEFSQTPGVQSLVLLEPDLFWEDDELVSLVCKEKGEAHLGFGDGCLVVARREAVGWMLRVTAHYSFSALTAILGVNYLDRFLSSVHFQRDKPWMTQLVAVACLSLAAKVEETQVPLLLDLQVEESKYVFEAKTIQRMELLILSSLKWRMNPVTPISFFDHITRRLGLKSHLHWDFLWKCERLLLSTIIDARFVCYLPSELATATMLHVVKEVDPCNYVQYQNQLLGILKTTKDKVDECYKLITELSGTHSNGHNQTHKRKNHPIPRSPNAVIDAYLSCDSSNDSWAVASSVSSSPEPPFKRSRAQDQQMRLPPVNRVSVDVLSSRQ